MKLENTHMQEMFIVVPFKNIVNCAFQNTKDRIIQKMYLFCMVVKCGLLIYGRPKSVNCKYIKQSKVKNYMKVKSLCLTKLHPQTTNSLLN
jgi:hypothetical protein